MKKLNKQAKRLKIAVKRFLHIHIVRRCYCFFGKHEIVDMEIQCKPIKYCKHCRYTEYPFLDGWHQIQRNSYVQSFIDNNA